jgi:hypothetical protein
MRSEGDWNGSVVEACLMARCNCNLTIGNGIPSFLQFSFVAIDLLLKLLNTSILAFPSNSSTRNGGHEHEKSAGRRIPKSLKN